MKISILKLLYFLENKGRKWCVPIVKKNKDE